MKKWILLISVIICHQPITAQWQTIKNGISWTDTDGNPIQAFGGNFLQYDGKWYMIGQDQSHWNAGVNMYSSSDLQTWEYEGKIIPPSAYASDRFIERPKLLHCQKTGKFIVWCHYEGAGYAASEAAVFHSNIINGSYTFHWGGRPLGIKSRDCNIFIDDNGTAYFVSTTSENTDLGLFKLSDDYLSIESHTLLLDNKYREAPAIVKINQRYFMITSGLTGWDPNQAKISWSNSISSGWSNMTNIGGPIAYDTQASSILTINGTEKTTYLYVGDRWKDPTLADSKIIMFPLNFSETGCDFIYKPEFDIDFSSGQTKETDRNYIPKTKWSIQYVDSEAPDYPITNLIDGNTTTIWHTEFQNTQPSHPHEFQIDLGERYNLSGIICVPRMDHSVNGTIRDYKLYLSKDGENWSQPIAQGWMSYHTEISFPEEEAKYIRLQSLSEFNGNYFASASEIEIIGTKTNAKFEVKQENNFVIYPNPVGSTLHIKSDSELWSIKIFNSRGSQIQSKTNINNPTITLNTHSFAKGLYFLHLSNKDNRIENRKIIIN